MMQKQQQIVFWGLTYNLGGPKILVLNLTEQMYDLYMIISSRF